MTDIAETDNEISGRIRFVDGTDDDKRAQIIELIKDFNDLFDPIESSLSEMLVFADNRTGAHYCECHIKASKFIKSSTTDVPLDPDDQAEYRANREVLDGVDGEVLEDFEEEEAAEGEEDEEDAVLGGAVGELVGVDRGEKVDGEEIEGLGGGRAELLLRGGGERGNVPGGREAGGSDFAGAGEELTVEERRVPGGGEVDVVGVADWGDAELLGAGEGEVDGDVEVGGFGREVADGDVEVGRPTDGGVGTLQDGGGCAVEGDGGCADDAADVGDVECDRVRPRRRWRGRAGGAG